MELVVRQKRKFSFVVRRFAKYTVLRFDTWLRLGYGQGAMIIRRALSELSDPERARISGVVFVDDFTRRGLKVPETLEDRLLSIALPFECPNLLPLPRTAYHFRDSAFPDTIEFIGGKMGES